MKSYITFILLIIPFLLYPQEFSYKHYDIEQGLSNNKVNAVLKDSKGFVWMGTSSGLNRFDGYHFKVFYSIKNDSSTINDNYVELMSEMSDGNLVIKTPFGYVIYDHTRERFIRNVNSYLKHVYGLDAYPAIMNVDAARNLWMIDYSNKGFVVKAGEKKATAIRDAHGYFKGAEIKEIIHGRNLSVFVTDRGGLIAVDAKTLQTQWMAVGEVGRADHRGIQYRGLIDSNNNLWIYSIDGLWIYDLQHRRLNDQLMAVVAPLGLVNSIAQDNEGNIWIGQHRNGVAIVDTKSNLLRNLSRTEQLENNTISVLYTDKDGSVWIGTYKKGVYQFNPNMYKFQMHEFSDVNCIAMAGGTDLWLGTDTGRLIRWNYKTGVALMSADVMVGGKARAVVCLSPDGDGGVWLGTYLGGLNYYKNGSIKNYPTGNSGAIENIWALTPAGNGKLWIGTLGDGVLLYDPATQQSEVFNVKNCGLNSDYISSLIVSHEGRLYIATNSGLSVLDLPSKKLIKDDKSVLNQLNKANVVQVYEDRRKLIWIATDEGLYMYDSSKNKLTSVGLNSWSRNVYILGICEDIQGAMWVSSGSELIKINLIQNTSGGDYTFESRTYTRQEGLQNSDFNQRSFCTVPSGEVFVGGMYGVNSFDPLTMPSDATAPRVMFTDLKLFNNSVVVGERYDGIMVLSESLNDVDVVNLKYLQNEFTICFAADNYVAQETTTFYYRLLGFNDEWIKCVGNLPQVTYTNLPPGSYTIEVKAVSNDGVESDEVARLKIVVYPPFWLSWWAKTLYLLLILLAIYYSVMLIKRRERKKYIAQKKSEAIKQQEELNRLKFKFFANISHELRTPLTLILSPIEAMLKAANDDKQKHRLEIVYGNANKLLNLVNQLLDFRKTEVAELKYLPIKGNIISFIKNQCDAFNAYSEDKHVSLTFFSNGQSLMMDFDADKMGKIVMNLLSNAFKFTPDGGRVDVAVTAGDDKVVIKVADTGIGISDEDKQRIFDCFYQTDTSNSAGSGIGLSLVKEYVKLHNGDVKVVDNAGGGSVFIITIPIHSANADAVSDEDSTAAASTTASTPTTAAESANASAESATPTASLSESAPAADKNTKGNRGHKVAKAEEKHHVEEDHKPTVLVVDDNADLRTFVNEELSADYHVITAADGKAALDILENHVPDIVVTDIMMPGIDGIELCRRMKANSEWAGIPIVVLTAKQDVQAKVEGLTIGADDYITKPFNCDILKLRINKLLSLSRKGGRRQLIEPEPSHVKVTSVDEKLIESAVKYVEENMASPDLSVEEMSRHLGMSRVHLYKRIRQITGMTPIEFIRIMRLKRAAQLLRESQRNVSEIAYAVGFNNPKYFSKYFKDEFGVLPSVYQENEGK